MRGTDSNNETENKNNSLFFLRKKNHKNCGKYATAKG